MPIIYDAELKVREGDAYSNNICHQDFIQYATCINFEPFHLFWPEPGWFCYWCKKLVLGQARYCDDAFDTDLVIPTHHDYY